MAQGAQGNPQAFKLNDCVRYRPGTGTYGYEDARESDGRIPALVIGHTPKRVRIRFRCRGGQLVRVAVDAANLVHDRPDTPAVSQ